MLWIAAAEASFYHPDDIARLSAEYARATNSAADAFEARQRAARDLGDALLAYEAALDLLGDRATAAERERLAALRTEYDRELAVVQAFANAMLDDFDAEFSAAMARAVAKAGKGASECAREVPSGRALPGMPARTKPNPDCTGDDLNPTLAAAMDADPALKKAVTEITALRWPDLDLVAAPVAPIGAGERWVAVHPFVARAAPDALRDIDRADAEAREGIAAAIEQGADADQLRAHLDEARRITAETAARRAEVGRPKIAAADAVLAKWARVGGATAWCAQPALLGGCAGADATAELVPRLLAEKKVQNAK